MTTIQANIPDSLARQVREFAEREHVSMDMVFSIALASQVSGWKNRDNIQQRAQRGSGAKFDRVMEKVRDVPLLPGDELPDARS
jgi:hypothetical protein